jgi:ribosomal protein S18 acetylase RimI-like enzyme
VIAELVLQSDCRMLCALFGPSVKRLLQHLQARPGNPYSFDNTLVIADDDGAVIGAMVGSVVAAMRKSNLRAAGSLFRWYGPSLIARLPGLLRAGKALGDQQPRDFYLSHIAVLPEHRGHGEGGVLLRASEERAKGLGAGRVVLDVDVNNVRARAFYQRLGYGQLSVVRIDLRRSGVFTLFRLGKTL